MKKSGGTGNGERRIQGIYMYGDRGRGGSYPLVWAVSGCPNHSEGLRPHPQAPQNKELMPNATISQDYAESLYIVDVLSSGVPGVPAGMRGKRTMSTLSTLTLNTQLLERIKQWKHGPMKTYETQCALL
jgi:hypothetical protein